MAKITYVPGGSAPRPPADSPQARSWGLRPQAPIDLYNMQLYIPPIFKRIWKQSANGGSGADPQRGLGRSSQLRACGEAAGGLGWSP